MNIRTKKLHTTNWITMIMLALCASILFFILYPHLCFAATPSGAAVISNAFQNLQGIVASFISSIGFIITLWGISEWGIALQSNDGGAQASAFKRIGGGAVMILGPQILVAII